jgi:hypothetical protein
MKSKEQITRTTQQQQIISFSVDREELRYLLELLQEKAYRAAEIEVEYLKELEGQTDEQLQQASKDLQDGFRLSITISGSEGGKLTEGIVDLFDSPDFPYEVKDVFFNSEILLHSKYNCQPRNKIIMFLDFGRPPLLRFTMLPSKEPRNESNIEVTGQDAAWVNGAFQEFSGFVSRRPSAFPWLQRKSVYYIIVLLLGIPLGFWVCRQAAPSIETILAGHSPYLRAAIYFCIFVFSLNILRMALRYARWIWPLIEYRSARNKYIKHKVALIILLSIPGIYVLYDILQKVLK